MTLPYRNSATKGHEDEKPRVRHLEDYLEDVSLLCGNPTVTEVCLASIAQSLKRIADFTGRRSKRTS